LSPLQIDDHRSVVHAYFPIPIINRRHSDVRKSRDSAGASIDLS
jgi:hypothetical protein